MGLPPDQAQAMRPGSRPGQVYLPELDEWVDMKSWTQEPIYDTELITTPVGQGDEYIFFRNPAFPTGVRKDLRHTNVITQQQLPSGWYARIYLMSIQILFMETAVAGLFTTPEDALRLTYQGVGSFITGSQKTEKEAPLIFWPSPLGLTPNVTRTGAGMTSFGVVNSGIPSLGATIPMKLPIDLSQELTFEGRVRFPGGMTLDNNTMIMFTLHTYMSKPLR